jgi:hypothetical protein
LRRRLLATVIASGALALVACGEEEEPPAPAAPPAPAGAPDAAREGGAERGSEVDRADGEERSGPPGPGTEAGPSECVFQAPPGRLAESRIVVELARISCDQGRQLAKAAAIGQPGGANLELTAHGFRCEPSTTKKGVNVSYVCADGPREARFDLVWSAAGP